MAHEHLSFFELDQLAVSPATKLAELGDCPDCLGYIDEQRRDIPVPGWTRALAAPRPSWWSRLRPVSFGVGLAAAACALFLVARTRDEDGVREKGLPTVSVIVKHQEEQRRWDGRAPIFPGDSLMLEVLPAGYREISVESLSGGTPEVLYRGPLNGDARVRLPRSYRVDTAPGPEKLRVQFGSGEKSWAVVLEMPKGLVR